MLSPPYSPQTVLGEDEEEIGLKVRSSNKNGGSSVSSTSTSTSSASNRNSSVSSSVSSTLSTSDTSSDDEYDFKAAASLKRSSSDLDDETLFDVDLDDDALSVRSACDTTKPHTKPHGRSGRERRMTTCWDALKTNPAKYLRQERSFLELYPLRRHLWAGPGVVAFSAAAGGDDESASKSPSPAPAAALPAAHASTKRLSARSGASTAAAAASAAAARGRKRTATSNGGHNGHNGGHNGHNGGSSGHNDALTSSQTADAAAPHGAGRSVGSAAPVRVHDLSLNQIEDYSPPLSSLPPGKSLRAEWKGAPMDLSNDPDLHLLHPAEAHLASVLRLPCEVYLDSKRRLFAEKVHRLKQGLPFRRTDSQKACRIDVNKASRLFGAFEKIGWLQDELFVQYLP